ncbi:MAG: type II toxin-antitoxin system RelB/DinJ family antitoxin [Candidatus Ornithomonoglobus sp.]
MAQSTFSIRMDDGLKKEFDSLCADFGMSMSTAITVFARTVVKTRKIPFEITASEPFYSENNQKYLMKSLADYKAGRLTQHELIEAEDE